MLIKVLQENTTERPDMRIEHGLSLYMETERHKLLFDAGASELFAENARAMGVDLSEVDIAVLSHGHYDHSGGLKRFLAVNESAKVYVSQYAFDEHYSGAERYIGVDKALKDSERVVLTGDYLKIDDELELFSCNDLERRIPTETHDLNALRFGALVPDDFRHEQYLLIRERGKRVLVSGCSHKGIVNIVDWFHPDVLIGGFHFMNLDPLTDGKETLSQAARELSACPATYYTCHCTGVSQYAFMKKRMGERLHYASCGMEIEV